MTNNIIIWAGKANPFPTVKETDYWENEETECLVWPVDGLDCMDAYHEYAEQQ